MKEMPNDFVLVDIWNHLHTIVKRIIERLNTKCKLCLEKSVPAAGKLLTGSYPGTMGGIFSDILWAGLKAYDFTFNAFGLSNGG